LVRADEIDILVDLSGHSSGNRLRAFARRCAPVQATWIGYLHSTGLAAMDFLIADAVAVPLGWEERFSEFVVRLPNSFLCYGTPVDTPEIKPPPLSRGAAPTFGCFSNLAKISGAVIDVWCKLLARHPEAQLYLKSGALADEEVCQKYERMFTERGIDAARVRLHGPSSRAEYFDSFSEIDMLLDTFPFSGGTTTCDALWMGVPVVTMPGDTMAGRTSASILSTLDLDAYIANDQDDYIERALDGMRNIDELARLRGELRQRLADSPVGDAQRFTLDLEQAYRRMWEQKVTAG